MNYENKPNFTNNKAGILMPSQAELIDKLTKAKMLGVNPEADMRLTNFATYIAGNEAKPGKIMMAWEMYMQESLSPEETLKLDKNFNKVIDIISPDKKLADEIKKCRQEAISEFLFIENKHASISEEAFDNSLPTITIFPN